MNINQTIMKKEDKFLPTSNMFFPIAIGVIACFVFIQCEQKTTETIKTNETSNPSSTSNGIRTLMVGGGESHDFDTWFKEADTRTLQEEGLSTVVYTDNTDSIVHYLADADVLYLTNNQAINDPKAREAIFDFLEKGKGLVLGHAALWYNWEDWPEYNQQIVSGGSRGHDQYGTFNVQITDTEHPVTQGVEQNFTLKDELYYFKVDEEGPGIDTLATASTEGSEVFPSVFVVKNPNARIVGIALGHDGESHDLDAYQTLLRNAIEWVAGK
jgi:type 1 glutamine amidotransferase